MRSRAWTSLAVITAILLSACGTPQTAPHNVKTPPVPTTSLSSTTANRSVPDALCGSKVGVNSINSVMVIWEENHGPSQVFGAADTPELKHLAAACGVANGYEALTHSSLPNYMAVTSGQSYARSPWNADCDPSVSCSTAAPSIFSAVTSTGKQWRSYVESMPSNCAQVSEGNYAAKHNPAVYYTSIRSDCQKWDVPMGTPQAGDLHDALSAGTLPTLTTLTPNLDEDMHNGTVSEADRWLETWIPQITASPQYVEGHLAVLIVWDEGTGSGNNPSAAPLVVMSASTPAGIQSSAHYDDYSLTRTITAIAGANSLGQGSGSPSLISAFGL